MAGRVLSWVLDLPLAVWVGFQWARALELASQRKPAETLDVINAMPERVQRQLSWALLRVQQYSVARDAKACADAARSIIPRIAKSRLSDREKSYLTGYA